LAGDAHAKLDDGTGATTTSLEVLRIYNNLPS